MINMICILFRLIITFLIIYEYIDNYDDDYLVFTLNKNFSSWHNYEKMMNFV